MKTKDSSKKNSEDKYKPGHENQNIRDFNPSQYVEENEVEKNEKTDNSKKSNKKKD